MLGGELTAMLGIFVGYFFGVVRKRVVFFHFFGCSQAVAMTRFRRGVRRVYPSLELHPLTLLGTSYLEIMRDRFWSGTMSENGLVGINWCGTMFRAVNG